MTDAPLTPEHERRVNELAGVTHPIRRVWYLILHKTHRPKEKT